MTVTLITSMLHSPRAGADVDRMFTSTACRTLPPSCGADVAAPPFAPPCPSSSFIFLIVNVIQLGADVLAQLVTAVFPVPPVGAAQLCERHKLLITLSVEVPLDLHDTRPLNVHSHVGLRGSCACAPMPGGIGRITCAGLKLIRDRKQLQHDDC